MSFWVTSFPLQVGIVHHCGFSALSLFKFKFKSGFDVINLEYGTICMSSWMTFSDESLPWSLDRDKFPFFDLNVTVVLTWPSSSSLDCSSSVISWSGLYSGSSSASDTCKSNQSSLPVSWAVFIHHHVLIKYSKASLRVYRAVIVLPHNDLYARAQKSTIDQYYKKSLMLLRQCCNFMWELPT